MSGAGIRRPPRGDSAAEWEKVRKSNPRLVELLQQNLLAVSRGEAGWAELLEMSDETLISLAKSGASWIDRSSFAAAERAFEVLTLLDPFVPTFWLSLGDARNRQKKNSEAIEAYGRCIAECLASEPPLPEIRTASYRRGILLTRSGAFDQAFEDLRRVVELDTDSVFDGERAYLVVQSLLQDGKITQEQFDSIPRPV